MLRQHRGWVHRVRWLHQTLTRNADPPVRVLNLKTVNALGLTIPETLLAIRRRDDPVARLVRSRDESCPLIPWLVEPFANDVGAQLVGGGLERGDVVNRHEGLPAKGQDREECRE
jgi:hypothetical protein